MDLLVHIGPDQTNSCSVVGMSAYGETSILVLGTISLGPGADYLDYAGCLASPGIQSLPF